MALWIFTILVVAALGAQDGQQIRVAVMDIEATDEIAENDRVEINALFANAVSETAIFRVVERQNIDAVLGEQQLQLSGNLSNEGLARIGEIENVEYLILGTVGKLFGKVVLAAKLVDVEQAKVVIARSLTSDEDRFFTDLKRFVLSLGSAAMDLNMNVTMEMVEQAIAEEDYPRAKSYLDRYVADNGLDGRTVALRDQIIPNLAGSYADMADRFRRDDKYQEAMEMIQRALSLRIDEQYVALRDRIIRDEDAYLEDQRIKAERQAQRLENRRIRYEKLLEEGETSLVSAWFNNLSVLGHHLGVRNEWPIDSSYALPSVFGIWGMDYLHVADPLGITAPGRDDRGTNRVNHIAYWGFSISCEPDSGNEKNTIGAEANISPYLARGFKLFNIVLLFGIDGGGGVLFSQNMPQGYQWYLLGGALCAVELKFRETFGVYGLLKGEYEWFPEDSTLSGPRLKASLGVVL